MPIATVKVPAQMEPVFLKAQEYVAKYFSERLEDPSKGTIIIGGERYILVRAASMSVQFFEFIKSLYPGLDEDESTKAAGSVLFDISHAVGRADAQAFHKTMHVEDPISKLSTGPVHFAYTGWASVDIFPESRPTQDNDYYLIYDHARSFESDSWVSLNKKSSACVCFMNSGYSSGWCEVSFGVGLTTREILCRAKGDPFCRFIMAPPDRIEGHVRDYREKHPELFAARK
ncbi:MAG: XylR N-terminal domain-containing protein [Elusimicrobiota bacterium]|jgi:predicted hydrocarbon binding protein